MATATADNTDAPNLDVFDLLTDTWSDNKDYTCISNPHTIEFSDDRKTAIFTYKIPPDRSGWPANLHDYHRSPEHSDVNVIRFSVLGVGDDWLALERQIDNRLGARVTPPRWRISLSNEDANYRWRLYGAPPGSHSLLRGVRCTPDSVIKEDEAALLAGRNLDPDLQRLVGTFEAPGRIMGRPVTYRAIGKAVLQGQFVRVELKELSVPSHYEAIVYIGRPNEEQFVAHWLDLFGPDVSTVIGHGEFTRNRELSFQFAHEEHTVVNVFRFHRERRFRKDRFDLVSLTVDPATGDVSETALYEFKRVGDEQSP